MYPILHSQSDLQLALTHLLDHPSTQNGNGTTIPKWSPNNGIHLETATVTNNLHTARNAITHRILGPSSAATIILDYSAMIGGDQTGLALLRDPSAWISVVRDNGATRVVVANNITMGALWNTIRTGSEVATADISGGSIWLRVSADIRRRSNSQGHFSYGMDGSSFLPLGKGFVMKSDWTFYGVRICYL